MKNESEEGHRFIIEAYSPSHHDRADFSCGTKRIDNFLHLTAKKHQKGDFTRVWVACRADTSRVVGFYSMNAHSLESGELPASFARNAPRHGGIPAIYLSMIGVDQSMQGKGLGSILMADAMKRVALISGDVGVAALVLDVLDDDARDRRIEFYKRLGFISLPSRPERMFIPTATIRNGLSL